MDKLNCFKKPQTQRNNNTRKVCLYSDESTNTTNKAKNLKKRKQSTCKTGFHLHHSNDSSSVRDSMQYYRIWIYSCNTVLGLTSIIFVVFAAFVLADVRLSLLRGFELYHPTFLYAYTALFLQCGIVQTVGCLGAQRLSHKLLSIYWILLLILTLGDIIVGLVWVFKLDEVKQALRPALTKQFLTKYSIDGHFTQIWNTVQSEDHCCGVDGPIDFDKFITSSVIRNLDPSSSGYVNDNVYLDDPLSGSIPPTASPSSFYLALPDSCCVTISYPVMPATFPHSKEPVSVPLDDESEHHRLGKRQAHNFSSDDELMYAARFVNSEHHNGRHHHLRHFIHPRKTAPTTLPNSPHEHPNQYSSHLYEDLDFHSQHTQDASSSSNNDDQLTELLIPFSCRNPAHNQIHHQSNLPKLNSFSKTEESFSSSSPSQKKNQARRNAILFRPLHIPNDDRPSALTLGNDNQANILGDENSIDPSTTFLSTPQRRQRHSRRHAATSSSTPSSSSSSSSSSSFKNKVRIYRNGCYVKLTQWLDHVTGILFILGFCIIGFVKICFLVILRCEIREMIEKIHLLETEGNAEGGGGTAGAGAIVEALTSPRNSTVNILQKQHSLQGNSYMSVMPACHFIKSSALELQNFSSPFLTCSSNYMHHHHLPPHYAQQHRHSTTPYWDRHVHQVPTYALQHRGSHCGSMLGAMGSSFGGCSGRRRPSGRSLNEMDIGVMGLTPSGVDVCCSNHSQETVNMTLLITSPTVKRRASTQSNYSNGSRGGATRDVDGSCGIADMAETSLTTNVNNEEEQEENILLQVPVKNNSSSNNNTVSTNEVHVLDQYEIRRSNFANHYCTWDSNVSCDSSASNIALDGSVTGGGVGRDHSSSSSLHALLGSSGTQTNTGQGNTQIVKVDMESHRGIDESLSPTQIQFIDEDQPGVPSSDARPQINTFSNNPLIALITYDNDNNGGNYNGGASAEGAGESVNLIVEGADVASSQRLLTRQDNSTESGGSNNSKRLLHANSVGSSTSNGSSTGLRKNGNNNSIDSGQSVDSDFIMSFIGTAV